MGKDSNEPVVDLAAQEPKAAKSRPRWGMPGRCPECSSAGYLDHIDMVDRVMFQHCTECGYKWTTSQEETVNAS
jgi:Zn ribbon nucleic-acid-binding protein